MKRRLALPKIAGIEINIHWTFAILIIWIVYSNLQAGLNITQIVWSVIFILSIFVCVTLHELGHALAARRYGIKTKDITLYPIGGVASLEKMPEKPAQEFVVAIAGPTVNIVIFVLLLPVLWHNDLGAQSSMVVGADNFLPMLGTVNISLALFNLLPAFPMDGGRILRALLAIKLNRVLATQIAASIGKLMAFGLILYGFYSNPFLIFIGIFIMLGANAEEQMVKSQNLMINLTAKDAMMTDFITLQKNDSIKTAVDKLLEGSAKNFLIADGQTPFGVIGRDDIIKGISKFGEQASLEEIAQREIIFTQPNTPLNDLFFQFRKTRTPLILISDGISILGVADADNVAELLMISQVGKLN